MVVVQKEGAVDLEFLWLFSAELAFDHGLLGAWGWALLGLLVMLCLFTWINLLGFREDRPRFCHPAYRTGSQDAWIPDKACFRCRMPYVLCSPGEGWRVRTGDGRDGPDPAPSLPSWWCRTVKCLVSIPWESTSQESWWLSPYFTPKAGTLEQFEKLSLDDSRRAKELQRR